MRSYSQWHSPWLEPRAECRHLHYILLQDKENTCSILLAKEKDTLTVKSISAERLTAKTVLVVDVPTLDYKTWYDTMENRILVPKYINSYSKKTKMFRSKWGRIFEQFKNQFAQH